MATGTAGNVGLDLRLDVKPCLRKWVHYSDFTTANARFEIGWLPPYAIVTGGGIWVATSFDDTNGDDLDVGVTGDDDDLFASGIDLNTASSLGTLDDLADANRYSTSARQVTCNFTTAASGNGTVGAAFVYIEFVIAGAP